MERAGLPVQVFGKKTLSNFLFYQVMMYADD